LTQTQQEPSLFLWIPRRPLQEQIGDALRSQNFGRLVVIWRSGASNKIYINYSCAQLRSDNISGLSPVLCFGNIPLFMTFVERCKRPTDAIAAQQRFLSLAMDDVLGQIV
jgi:hypothetical protein